MHSKYYDTRVYICSHCGAEVVTSDTEVSTFCVYCGNPAIVFNRIAKEYRPDGIIPFTVTKEDAIKYINLKFRKNLTVPKEVMDKVLPQNIRGIYISRKPTISSVMLSRVSTNEKSTIRERAKSN